MSDLNLLDKLRGYFSPEYEANAKRLRGISGAINSAFPAATERRTDRGGWSSSQPFANSGTRTLTPQKRQSLVKRARQMDEESLLASSMLDRSVDNIIGCGMTVQAMSGDRDFNKEVEARWKDYEQEADVRQMMSFGELQASWYRSYLRDGDVLKLLLNSGQLQTIESDFVQSPSGPTDLLSSQGRDIIDGVEIDDVGKAIRYHIAAQRGLLRQDTQPYSARDCVFYANQNRNFRTATRGVPVLAQLGPIIEQIDGTIEAVADAYRLAACFGLLIEKENPSAAVGGLALGATNSAGQSQAQINIEPAMVQYLQTGESVSQVKAEHPTSSFEGYMKIMVRFAGLKLGLPLELAMLDFSETNYSSARASMEQAYRRFRVEQKRFADRSLSKIYRWRVSKWVKNGELPTPPSGNWLTHQWYGQEWPYLDPQKEANGTLVAIDAGTTTLTKELAKRGVQLEDWIEQRKDEIERQAAAGIPLVRSTSTRDPEQNTEGAANVETTETDD